MTALQLIKEAVQNAREIFDGTIGDIRPEDLHKDPGGKAFPLGATVAHLIFSEDTITHQMLQGKAPLSAGEWAGKTGASEPMPAMDANWVTANERWAKTVQIDWTALLAYKHAVCTATDAYLNTLTDADLERVVDLGDWGKKTVAELFYSFIIGHTNSLAGEVSALKGVHGAKGYPF